MERHNEETEAMDNFLKQVEAVRGGQWIGVIAHVADDGSVLLCRTAWKFPTDRFLTVVGLLANDLMKEASVSHQPAESLSALDFMALQEKLRKKSVQGYNSQVTETEFPATSRSDVFQLMRVPSHLLRDDDPVHEMPIGADAAVDDDSNEKEELL